MSEKIKYHKMNGAGNEFIIIDNSEIGFAYTPDIVASICSNSPDTSCDQLITIQKRVGQCLDLNIWNKDGSKQKHVETHQDVLQSYFLMKQVLHTLN